jgi:glutaminyl-peptide cyclotransferase
VQETAPSAATPLFASADGTAALARAAALVALGPRDAGTPGAAAAATWIAEQLSSAGIEARIDRFEESAAGTAATFRNVVAERPGPSGEWLVLLSHFDTKGGLAAGFAGANDGASSTGLLIEIARRLAASGPWRHGWVAGFLDGEECRVRYGPRDGLHGSRRLAGQFKREGRRVRAVVVLDMVGDRDLQITVPRNGTPALAMALLDAAGTCGHRERFGLYGGEILDDHQPFLDAGFPAIDVIDFDYGSAPGRNDYWHTPADTLDKLSADSLRIVGQTTLELVRRLQAP